MLTSCKQSLLHEFPKKEHAEHLKIVQMIATPNQACTLAPEVNAVVNTGNETCHSYLRALRHNSEILKKEAEGQALF